MTTTQPKQTINIPKSLINISQDINILSTQVREQTTRLQSQLKMYQEIIHLLIEDFFGALTNITYTRFSGLFSLPSEVKLIQIIGVYDSKTLDPVGYEYDSEKRVIRVTTHEEVKVLYVSAI